MASLDGPLIKYTRARQHVETLKGYLLPIENLESYVIVSDIDNDTGEQIRRFEDVPSMPDGVDVIIGEMLYNYRCSLDYLIWQLVLSEGNDPTERNEFPIFDNPTRYKAEKGRKLQGVSSAVVRIVDALQPCNSTGPDDYWKWLWYLHSLNNADKHRHLLLTRGTLGGVLRISGFFDGRTPSGHYLDVPVEKGAIFFRGKFDMDMNIEPRISVVFSNAPPDIRTDLPVLNIALLIKASVDVVFERLSSHVK